MPAGMEEICGDARHVVVIEAIRTSERPLVDVDDADDYGRLAGPFLAARRGVDGPAVLADPAQAGAPRVALVDRIRGDQAEGALISQHGVRAAEEVGHEIPISMRLF